MKKILRIGGAGKRGFFEAAILNFLSRPFWIFFCFISVKNPALLYEVSFFSALWMVSSEFWKRLHSNSFAHDCTYFRNGRYIGNIRIQVGKIIGIYKLTGKVRRRFFCNFSFLVVAKMHLPKSGELANAECTRHHQ